MSEWKNVTDTFSEKQRHYRNTYLEICEVMDDAIEISVFRAQEQSEIYVSFGKMYGITYANNENVEQVYRQMKNELKEEYLKNKEPSDDFIDSFAKKYKLQIENSLFDEEVLMEMFF